MCEYAYTKQICSVSKARNNFAPPCVLLCRKANKMIAAKVNMAGNNLLWLICCTCRYIYCGQFLSVELIHLVNNIER